VSIHTLTIAVPVYNEGERVGAALKALLDTAFPIDIEVLVIDDGSSDDTWEVLNAISLPEQVRLIRHERNKGKGAALRTAIEHARGDVFVPFDADLEYDPADLVRCLQPMLGGEADVVFGTRAFGSHTAFNFWYVMGNRFITLWANVLFNCYISDLETCFKMARTDVLRGLDLRSNGFDIEPEVTGKLLRAGHRPYEVQISYKARSRDEGKKINWRDGVRALWVLARIRFSH
jgi:glycosyltransferase involved in cell wall biosynthesis